MSTAYQDPAADHGTNQWTKSGGPPPVPTGHWDCVNDGVRSPATNGDGYLLYVAGSTQNLREEFALTASPSGVGTVTAIKVWGRGYRTQGSGSNVDIQADVYVAGARLRRDSLLTLARCLALIVLAATSITLAAEFLGRVFAAAARWLWHILCSG